MHAWRGATPFTWYLLHPVWTACAMPSAHTSSSYHVSISSMRSTRHGAAPGGVPRPRRVTRHDWRHLVLRRAPSKEAWLLRMYAPVALFAAAYASFLTTLGVLTPADWENGACSLAIVTAPIITTIALALGTVFVGDAPP